MSAESDGAADEIVPAADYPQPAAVPARQPPGELLRAAREQSGLTLQQAADELHLDARQIGAIESNNFQLLGAPVYAKGHLRKYASLLGLSPETVIGHYQALTDVPAVPIVTPLTKTPWPRERISMRIPAWIVGLLIVGAAAWWLASWLLERRAASQPAVSISSNVAMPVTIESAGQPSGVEQTPSESQPGEPSVSQPAVTAAGTVTMRLQFATASWAEVYDATDKRLMFEVGQPGTMRTFSGTPPLKVNLGVASAVSLQVNDRPVPIPRNSGKDATRFVIAADGSVR